MSKNKMIWFYRWDALCKGIDLGLNTEVNCPGIHHVKLLTINDQPLGGETCCRESEMFDDPQACLDAHQAEEDKRLNEYLNAIQTMENLVDFLLNQIVIGEDADYTARQAALQAAAKLGLNIQTKQ